MRLRCICSFTTLIHLQLTLHRLPAARPLAPLRHTPLYDPLQRLRQIRHTVVIVPQLWPRLLIQPGDYEQQLHIELLQLLLLDCLPPSAAGRLRPIGRAQPPHTAGDRRIAQAHRLTAGRLVHQVAHRLQRLHAHGVRLAALRRLLVDAQIGEPQQRVELRLGGLVQVRAIAAEDAQHVQTVAVEGGRRVGVVEQAEEGGPDVRPLARLREGAEVEGFGVLVMCRRRWNGFRLYRIDWVGFHVRCGVEGIFSHLRAYQRDKATKDLGGSRVVDLLDGFEVELVHCSLCDKRKLRVGCGRCRM